MYSVGHLALGYLVGKATSKFVNVKVNLPLLFVASILPDIDILLPGLEHRGITHSTIFLFLLFLPVLVLFGKKATPYFVALSQHILIGDYLIGETQLLWPINSEWYGLGIQGTSLINISIEWIFFLTSIAIMLRTRDTGLLFQRHPSNLTLSIPVFTVILPIFLSFPLTVPLELVIPHLTYLTLFAISILIHFGLVFSKT